VVAGKMLDEIAQEDGLRQQIKKENAMSDEKTVKQAPELSEKDLNQVVGGDKVSQFLDGIDGESHDDKHKGEIQLQSYSFGSTKSPSTT
jgi:bacteriocin-like protein